MFEQKSLKIDCSFKQLFFHRLCGKVPFQSDKPKKLEEVILKGDLKFAEVEWSFVSDKGKLGMN